MQKLLQIVIIHYDQYTIKSSYAKVNRESGAVFAKNADVKSIDGNEFSANQAKEIQMMCSFYRKCKR